MNMLESVTIQCSYSKCADNVYITSEKRPQLVTDLKGTCDPPYVAPIEGSIR